MRSKEFLTEGPMWNAIKRTFRKLFNFGADRHQYNKAAVKSLEDGMMKLSKIDYDSIDQLMKFISKQSKISPQKLHDLFVQKHGVIPDKWIEEKRKKWHQI